ncbi:MAG: alpha hydrolase [Thermoplasmata archaeon]|nr:MAG: alpha hydrolase [Thermoplasmata archaeon]
MRCKFCGRDADIYIPYPRMHLCKEHFIVYFERKIERTINRYKMFSKEDKILIAIGGGKDSAVASYILKRFGYTIEGLFLDLGIGGFSEKSRRYAEKQCKDVDIPIHRVEIRKLFNRGINEVKSSRPTCAICGATKRYIFNKFAYDNDFNVLVTGHNLDDESSFVLSNLINWNIEYLGRQGPILPGTGKFIRKVKPLYEVTEVEIKEYADVIGIEYISERCPLSKGEKIPRYKHVLNELEKMSSGVKINFIKGFLRNRHLFKFDLGKSSILKECKVCGMPSQGEVCVFCRIWGLDKPVELKVS